MPATLRVRTRCQFSPTIRRVAAIFVATWLAGFVFQGASAFGQHATAPALESPVADAAIPAAANEPASQPAPPDGAPTDLGAAAGEAKRVGHLIPVSAPLPNVERLRRGVRQIVDESRGRGEWPVLVFEFKNGRSPFGQTLDLARFLSGPELDGTTTIAWLPSGARGHVVLLALACDEIVMPADAEIGQAGADEESIGPDLLSVYREIAQRRKTIPPDVALGLLNPALEVYEVETEMGREFVLRDALDELAKRQAIVSQKVIIRWRAWSIHGERGQGAWFRRAAGQRFAFDCPSLEVGPGFARSGSLARDDLGASANQRTRPHYRFVDGPRAATHRRTNW
jgi:hypothetical protein